VPALCWRWRWVVYSSSSPRVIGFVGNEIAAPIRTRAGKRLNSPALVAYGNPARVDGFVSLGVIASAAVVALGVPVADPVIGLVITLVILHIAWESWAHGARLWVVSFNAAPTRSVASPPALLASPKLCQRRERQLRLEERDGLPLGHIPAKPPKGGPLELDRACREAPAVVAAPAGRRGPMFLPGATRRSARAADREFASLSSSSCRSLWQLPRSGKRRARAGVRTRERCVHRSALARSQR
jgi:Cation efflux family